MKYTIFCLLILVVIPSYSFAETLQETKIYRIVVRDIVSEHLEVQLLNMISQKYRDLLCKEVSKGALVFETGDQKGTKNYPTRARIVCSGKEKEENATSLVVTSSIFRMKNNNYLIYSKATDPRTGTCIKTRSVEHQGGLEILDLSLEKMVDQMADKSADTSDDFAAFKESVMKQSKWHITALSISAVAILWAYDTTLKYNDLSSENSDIRSQYLLASSQADIDQYRSQYNDNVETMEEHEQTITYLMIVATAVLSWEGYLLYQAYKDSRYSDQTVLSQKSFYIVPVMNPTSKSPGLSLSWKF